MRRIWRFWSYKWWLFPMCLVCLGGVSFALRALQRDEQPLTRSLVSLAIEATVFFVLFPLLTNLGSWTDGKGRRTK